MLLMEATDKPAAGRMAKLREELGRIAIPSRGRRGWSLDTEEEGRERRSDGRFLLFTTDTGLSAEEVVAAYFQRDEVEKAFSEMKGKNAMGPIR